MDNQQENVVTENNQKAAHDQNSSIEDPEKS